MRFVRGNSRCIARVLEKSASDMNIFEKAQQKLSQKQLEQSYLSKKAELRSAKQNVQLLCNRITQLYERRREENLKYLFNLSSMYE
jgi:hypothetical protein